MASEPWKDYASPAESSAESGPWNQYVTRPVPNSVASPPATTQRPKPSSAVRRVVGDTAVDLGRGVIGLGEAVVGAADLVTGGHAGKAGEILDRCVEHGLLTLQAGPDVLRFVPALNIGDEDVAEGLARLRAAIAAFVVG